MAPLKLFFGNDSGWDLPADSKIASMDLPIEAAQDEGAAVQAALQSPLEFPSLDQAVVPGDRLVFAVDPALPGLVRVVSSTVEWFAQRGTPISSMQIVLARDATAVISELSDALRAKLGQDIAIELHDFDDPEKVAYVAANESSDPIYLSRKLVDADVVIPITCARPGAGLDYFGCFGLFPLLTNRATRAAFYNLPALEATESNAQLTAWATQAAWWVGIVVSIQVVPAGRDRVAAVFAGLLEPVESASQNAIRSLWRGPAVESELVLATVAGDANQQSWLGVARTLHLAMQCTAPNGSIVIATQTQEPIGTGLNRLRNQHLSPETIAKKLASDGSDDAIAAAALLNAIASHHVYFISGHRSEAVESLGLGAIKDHEQLMRLIHQHDACTLIEAAEYRCFESSIQAPHQRFSQRQNSLKE